ncbi:MAG: polysaccharide biosynthesis protein [Alphaproteobacteria bacterium]
MRRISRAGIAYSHDIVMAALSFVLSLLLRMGGDVRTLPIEFILFGAAVFAAVAAAVFWPMGLYRGVWRYASMNDLWQITKAVTLTVLLFVPIMFLATRAEFLPRSQPIINWFVLMALLGGPRFMYRLLKDRHIDLAFETPEQLSRVPVLLVGAGDDAETFIRAMTRRDAAYRVVGALDEKGHRVGRKIHHVPVIGSLDDLEEIVVELEKRGSRPQRLVVTKPGLSGARMRRLLDDASSLRLTLCRLPRLTEFKGGVSDRIEVLPVDVQDLLGRPQAALDKRSMRELVEDRRVLITGAGGTIGSELVRQVAEFGPRHLSLLDSSEQNLYAIELDLSQRHPELPRMGRLTDIRDAGRLRAVFTEAQPDLVFHAAALKHVPMVEAQPLEGIKTNAIGSRNVAEACKTFGVKTMVLISTDKAVKPKSVMGASKRIAESYCQALDIAGSDGPAADGGWSRFITVRFGNVLGSTGSVVPLFQRQLAAGGPLTVTHPDMKRYFMTVREAVELVLQASALGVQRRFAPGPIFVLDMGEPVRILDLARQIIRLADKRPGKDVEIVFTGPRPGEKLHEQLFDDAEPLADSDAKGILLAATRTADLKLLSRTMDELEDVARAGNADKAIDIVCRLVPEYAPEHPRPEAAAAGAE